VGSPIGTLMVRSRISTFFGRQFFQFNAALLFNGHDVLKFAAFVLLNDEARMTNDEGIPNDEIAFCRDNDGEQFRSLFRH